MILMKMEFLCKNDSESSLIEDIKAKQDLASTIVELKKLVVEKKIEVFSQGGDGVLCSQG